MLRFDLGYEDIIANAIKQSCFENLGEVASMLLGNFCRNDSPTAVSVNGGRNAC